MLHYSLNPSLGVLVISMEPSSLPLTFTHIVEPLAALSAQSTLLYQLI
jgi:hypothetical protein